VLENEPGDLGDSSGGCALKGAPADNFSSLSGDGDGEGEVYGGPPPLGR